MACKNALPFAASLCLVASLASGQNNAAPGSAAADYVIGPQDVLTITSYDQADLSSKFTVEADGTFTYPYIGRVRAGGQTLRTLEAQLKKQLIDDGYFKNPQITVAVETYKSQKIFIVGEVRQPGTYPLSGRMNLVEVLARAGSTLPTSSGEAIIVHTDGPATGPTLPSENHLKNIEKVDLRELQNGEASANLTLRDGDTVFIPKAESIYVFGQVKNGGAYALQHRNTTVLQALSLAGGISDRGSTSRLKIIRTVNGKEREIKARLTDLVKSGDTIIVGERFF